MTIAFRKPSQIIALISCGLLLDPCLQQSRLFAQDAPPSGDLKIAIIEGEGFTNNVKKRTAREEIVEVRDRNNSPIPGAIITFSVSSQGGAGGVFSANGSNLVTVTTNQAGRAVTMFKPNAVQGSFKINVTASFHGQTAAASIAQTNAIAAGAGAGAAGGIGGFIASHALVAGLVAGAVVATTATAVAVAGGGGKTAKVSVGQPTLP